MSVEQSHSEISRKISESWWFRWLSILSVVGALFGLALAVPTVRNKIYNDGPDLNVRLASEIPVLGINQQIKGLNVFYEGKNLIENAQQLTAIRVIIENSGGTSIRPADVSQNDPIGFSINGAEIVRIAQFKASSVHLKKFATPKITKNTLTISNNIIIDSKENLSFDLIVLKNYKSDIGIFPYGKVAGISSIKYIDNSIESSEGVFERSLNGSIFV